MAARPCSPSPNTVFTAAVFVPAAVERVGPLLTRFVLGLGVVVQLLALSVDPQRLLLEKAIPFTYYVTDPWLQLRPEASHLHR